MTSTNHSLPPGACDCHMHVYEAGYAVAPTATFAPPLAPAAAYRKVQRAIGLQRVVVVQPTAYGFDNACTLAATAFFNASTEGLAARAVGMVPLTTSDSTFDELHAAGMRAVRFMMLPGGPLPWSDLAPMAARLADRGWHINLQLDGNTIEQHAPALQQLPCRLAIDHIGKFLGPVTPKSPAFRALQRVLDRGTAWIKLSAPYESSLLGPPDYADISPIAQALARDYPERCVWASNWPHPNVKPAPTEAALLDWTLRLLPSSHGRQRLLVDNPAELYGF
jgi:D-galactarolactone isomerase